MTPCAVSNKQQFEREFFSLAAVWLNCRQHLLLAETEDMKMWHFLGEMDYHSEMHFLLFDWRHDPENALNGLRSFPKVERAANA